MGLRVVGDVSQVNTTTALDPLPPLTHAEAVSGQPEDGPLSNMTPAATDWVAWSSPPPHAQHAWSGR